MTNFIKLLDAAAQTAEESSAVTEAVGRVPSEHIDMMWSTLFTGLVVVFLILILLVIVLWALGKVMNIERKPKAKKKAEPEKAVAAAPAPVPAPIAEAVEEEDDSEIIAVIAAAIAAYGESEGKQYKIASIKRKEKAVRSNWSAAGIAENTRPF